MNFAQLGLIVITVFMAHLTIVIRISFLIRRTTGVAIHGKLSSNSSTALCYAESVRAFGLM
jgi:hypothetical protein